MWLVQIGKFSFIDVEKMVDVWFDVKEKIVKVTMVTGEEYYVGSSFAKPFLNHLQAINKNTSSVESVIGGAVDDN